MIENCIRGWDPSRIKCIDKSGVRLVTPHMPVSYNKSKPIRVGVDIYSLCDAGKYTRGYCIDSFIYGGKYTYEKYSKQEIEKVGKKGIVARILMDGVHGQKENVSKGDIVIMDNAFNSVPLLDHYYDKGIGVIGTFNSIRSDKPSAFTSQYKTQKWKDWKRGQYEVYEHEHIHFTAWKDSKIVFFIDNCIYNENYTTVKRRRKANKN